MLLIKAHQGEQWKCWEDFKILKLVGAFADY